MGKAFYLEIGSEEIPAGYIRPALEAMARQLTQFFDDQRIGHGRPLIGGTPRRLCLHVPDVAERQQAGSVEVLGPPRQVAFDAAGKPTKAAEGFARNQGVAVGDLRIKSTPKGEYVVLVREESGQATRALLEPMLADFIAHIPFPKSMRWADLQVTFARPVRWITALLGGDVVNFQYGDITSGNQSFGHRFMNPQWLTVTDHDSHRAQLERHHVIVDFDQRRELIARGIVQEAAKVGGRVLDDPELLEEVTQLVEFPYPLLGEFEEKYLELPPQVPITVMKEHQRYFAVVDADGKLMRYFVTVANTIPRDPALVAAGNARVIRARLEDARFYYEEDRKVRLDQRAEQLKDVVFHSKLGTSWEKMERFRTLARWLGEQLGLAEFDTIERAAKLCKADLVTGMVGQFPELQGVMGRDYALKEGEPEAVAEAIHEHYLPIRAGGPLPERIEGAVLSIADKIDTIVGCFSVGLIPTGTTDPFALRRQTLGIIRIILEKDLPVSLEGLIDQALPLLDRHRTEPLETVRRAVLGFFQGRLHHLLTSQDGYATDLVEAALAPGIDNLAAAVARTRALNAFKQRADFEALAAAFKRVVNIIKDGEPTPVEPARFTAEAETALHQAVQNAAVAIRRQLDQGDYGAALEAIAALKAPIDRFFDQVLVMDKDEALKRNRLALLTAVHDLFSGLADFRKIQTG